MAARIKASNADLESCRFAQTKPIGPPWNYRDVLMASQDRTPRVDIDTTLSRAGSELLTAKLSPAELLLIEQQELALLARMFDAKPDELGRYLLREKLGEGGMGVVYAAYDPKLQRKVALKLLSVDHPDLRRRFLREARAMARLCHPNAVEIHEVGEIHGQAFLAMEFIEGVTLREWLATPHECAEILEVFVAAGRGLAGAHERGLVHRDFKPSNVMIDDRGHVRVMDFGVAWVEPRADAPQSSVLTRSGVVLGTPGYMSPEQARGDRSDSRSDQFSFCVALYEALFGQRPFACASGETPEFVALDPRGPRRGTRPADLDPAVELAVIRGLALDPDRRFTSMNELLALLEPRAPVRSIRRLALPALFASLLVLILIGLVAQHRFQTQADARRDAYVHSILDADLKAAHAQVAHLLDPFEGTLLELVEHAKAGDLDGDDPSKLNDELRPLLAGGPSSISTIDAAGNGYTLWPTKHGSRSRADRPGQSPDVRTWTLEGLFDAIEVIEHEPRDLRSMPWYRAAGERRNQVPLTPAWTLPDSYDSNPSGPGLWVSAPAASEQRQFVIAIEVPLHQLSKLTTDLSLGRRRFFAFDGDDRVLGLPHAPAALLLTAMRAVDDELVNQAFMGWTNRERPAGPFRIEIEGHGGHWVEVRQFDETPIWIGMIIPESISEPETTNPEEVES